ncbi:MEDS domain-containing protein [Paraburkholderia sp. DGU8]|uniref:MEDS domain-containing protein n=1 Tax=Paraburkholderia sp. DGU8 TaxID=3161997 RepID=UPI0034651776
MTDTTKRDPCVHLAGKMLTESRHACAFFNSRAEEYRVLLPFIKETVDQSERSIFLLDPKYRAEHLRWLEQSGIDVVALRQRGQIEIHPWEEAYLRGGRFNPDAMLSLIDGLYAASNVDGFSHARLWASMDWALQDQPGVTDLVEYEARLNYLLPKYDHITVCVYDLAKFSASVIMDVVRTHPLVIIGGNLQENPFFVPPDEFLRELRSRLP